MTNSAIDPFTFNTTPAIVFRDGATGQLGEIAARKLGKKVLFITDPGLRALGLTDQAVASMEAQGMTVTIFDAVEADPSRATLTKAVETGRAAGADAVVGFGGGSSQDVAKLCALLLGSGEDLDEAWGVGNAKGPRLPLVLVPTTA
ncbi:iron-containing alcohol dehydrogenase, partial [Mesorhizobium sp. J18]|uniref:iron-containing alcohol dehydrogenase n=1 Tax=Mesorhizobium sp. J18 TaxID=935263 RepID=UPI001FEDBF90